MAILLVASKLKTKGKDYTPFFSALKSSGDWWHYMEDIWIIDTNLSADALAKKLYPHMTQEDRLLVVKITREHQGWLPTDAWEWLNKRNY